MQAIHQDFQHFLDFKSKEIINLYTDLRAYLLEINPVCIELLYHTHALTSVYTLSPKLSDGYCHIPIYTNHLNLGFNKGTLLDDPHQLLHGTGKWIRHLPINSKEDYRNNKVKDLIINAIEFTKADMKPYDLKKAEKISKIKI